MKLNPESAHFLVDDFQMARELAKDGAGVALLPSFVARDSLRQGLLEEVSIPDASLISGGLVLLYPSSGQLPRKVTSFRDFLHEALRAGAA